MEHFYDKQDTLTRNKKIVGRLVSKLPESLQLDWSRAASRASTRLRPGVNDWEFFMNWLNGEREAALIRRNYQLIRGDSDPRMASSSSKSYCARCRTMDHKTAGCKMKSTLADVNQVNVNVEEDNPAIYNFVSDNDREEAYKRAEAKAGKCPLCKLPHSYQRPSVSGHLTWPSAQLGSCEIYQKMSPVERGQKIQELNACPKCTNWTHQRKDCWK